MQSLQEKKSHNSNFTLVYNETTYINFVIVKDIFLGKYGVVGCVGLFKVKLFRVI